MNVLCLGDSITQLGFTNGYGWVSLLQDHFQRRAVFINRGFAGYSTKYAVSHVLPKLESSLAGHGGAKIATVFFGANDSVLKTCQDNSQHVPIEVFIANLITIITKLKAMGVEKIVLITIPLYDDEAWKIATCKKYSLETVESKREISSSEKYRSAVVELCEKENLILCDFWSAMREIDNWKELLSDGLHLSNKGQKLLAENLIKVLDNHLPIYEHFMPDWKSFDIS